MTTPADALSAMFNLDSDLAAIYDDAAHHLAYLAASRAVRESAAAATAAIASAVVSTTATDGRTISPTELLAVAIVQRLSMIVRTLAGSSDNPLAVNLREHAQLVDVTAAQLPAEIERWLADADALAASAARMRRLLSGKVDE